MALSTQTLALGTGPVDLLTVTEIAAEIAAEGDIKVLVQNTSPSTAKIFYAENVTEPATTDRGHCLDRGDSFVLSLGSSNPTSAWVWSAATTATLTFSSAD